ncbi:MAG: type I DNA topoisomerase [Elusimicrobiales bacterium]|nr:type I DNA topoisomerase [Elusimicrobiales bacterium]
MAQEKKDKTKAAKAEPKAAPKTSAKAKIGPGKYLVIVESPTKEKTISRFLDANYVVKSSFGHVRDLPKDELGVEPEKGFEPKYVLIERARRISQELTALAKNSEYVYLATDPDREGEAISWHLSKVIAAAPDRFKRISFHEITKTAIAAALKSPRDLDMNLVNAQQARRVIDRLVGYKLSPLLWDKVKSGLSAGRVQSVAVRLVAERAKEIAAFKEEDYYTLFASLAKEGGKGFDARLVRWKGQPVEQTITLKLFAEDYRYRTTPFKKLEDTAEAATLLRGSELKVSRLEAKTARQKPKPPFITSSLQQDAYNKLGYSSDRTMRIAQSLYEGVDMEGDRAGLITYMRTDSFNVSADMQAETARFVAETYGKDFAPEKPPVYLKKVKGAQEAHEAIHPTSVYKRPSDVARFLTAEQAKLYELIWNRFVASQMADAVFDSVTVEVSDPGQQAVLRATGRTMKFEGYLKVYMAEKEQEVAGDEDEDDSAVLPPLKEGEVVSLKDVAPKPHRTSPPPNYNEASIIKTLEKHGIGRPSTYAVIIKTIIERGYIKREKDKRLLITELGSVVTEKLKDFFREIMELSYTASIEDKLDDIADGALKWNEVITEFYGPFSTSLTKAQSDMTRTRPGVVKTNEKCPLCLSPMVQRESRFGKYLSCSRFPKCKGKIPLDKDGNKQEYFAPIKTEKICSKCGKNAMLLRKSARGYFLACSGFPKCRSIDPVTPEEVEKIIASSKPGQK